MRRLILRQRHSLAPRTKRSPRAHRDHRERYFCWRVQGFRFLGLLAHSFYLRLFSVTSVAPVVKSFWGTFSQVGCLLSPAPRADFTNELLRRDTSETPSS